MHCINRDEPMKMAPGAPGDLATCWGTWEVISDWMFFIHPPPETGNWGCTLVSRPHSLLSKIWARDVLLVPSGPILRDNDRPLIPRKKPITSSKKKKTCFMSSFNMKVCLALCNAKSKPFWHLVFTNVSVYGLLGKWWLPALNCSLCHGTESE